MKKVASILAVVLFAVGMFATAINAIDTDNSDSVTEVACDSCANTKTRGNS
ncbi:hypothetical protein [uncultured Maribacter sp.]|uniref:hypothetical protein n=1 Tax=uncultured Maribacter sp. TaxID=431308 RepID=UPI0026336E29|nr:hypothetical protein [uncultured Maribacter sp.]